MGVQGLSGPGVQPFDKHSQNSLLIFGNTCLSLSRAPLPPHTPLADQVRAFERLKGISVLHANLGAKQAFAALRCHGPGHGGLGFRFQGFDCLWFIGFRFKVEFWQGSED